MHFLRRRSVALVCLVLSATACTAAGGHSASSPAAVSSPTASWMAPSIPPTSRTPAPPAPTRARITARPSTEAEREQLAQEAEQVFVAAYMEQLRLSESGGVAGELPESLAKYLIGAEAQDRKTLLNSLHQRGGRLVSGRDKVSVVRVGINAAPHLKDSLLSMQFCTDPSATRWISSSNTSPKSGGKPYLTVSEFRRHSDGSLRISAVREDVTDKC